MAKEEIVECLNNKKSGANNRKLLAFCREPKLVSELNGAGVKGEVFKVLVSLKKSGALSFEDGKYFSTQLGLDILDSMG